MKPSAESLVERYQTILDSITEGVYSVNLDWRIIYFNRAAEKITGIPRKDAIGQSCSKVFRSNVCKNQCVVRETLGSNRPVVNKPVYIIRADQKRIPISVTTTLLKDSGKKVVGGVVTFRDLTDVSKLRKELLRQHSYEDIISKNAKMHRIFSILPQVAHSHSTVLLRGDSGTGKEILARAIHNNSPQKKGPFIAVNCGALPDSLCESELFGYKAGAFTDAKKDKPGRFAQAQNGTLFLDEMGDVSPAMQMRLLRVLEQRQYEPLGATKPVATNARIVTATHRNIEKRVKEGKFREDLFYRINVVEITLPPLAERKEDIPLLVNYFIDRFNRLTGRHIIGVSQKTMASLLLYDWPGNVRELENAIERAFVLCENDIIRMRCLPDRVLPPSAIATISPGLTLQEIEKRAIQQALERNNWRKVTTAMELGIYKNTLRRKMIRLGIKP
ncbi:MAG: sigma 54-interacting transcriptional regulator [Desulfobacterales bacterium]|nr:sigma 54-interacting transcriptional regulator [Desulfobacterales bacterium]